MIREYESGDLKDVMDLWLETNIQVHNYISPAYWHEKFELVKSMLPDAEILVFEQAGAVKAFVGTNNGYIAGLFVSRDSRSKGIGKQLLECLKQKHSQLHLQVYEKNKKATKFYEREGFLITNQQIDESTKECELCMKWEK